MSTKNLGLGKGLEAIIPGWHEMNISPIKDKNITEIEISKIKTGVYQPRKNFNEESLQELADSIKEHGIIQPLVVVKDNDEYILVAGERRLRASQMCGLAKVPIVIQNYKEDDRLEIALIENLQREDLNAIEEAEIYSFLIEKYNLKQEDLANRINKSRPYIANMLRLLGLSDKIKNLVISGKISSAKARTLLSIENEDLREKIAKLVAKDDLSVKEIEKIVSKNQKIKIIQKSENEELTDYIFAVKNKFKEKFSGNNIVLNMKENENNVKGDIKIKFESAEELNKILEILGM